MSSQGWLCHPPPSSKWNPVITCTCTCTYMYKHNNYVHMQVCIYHIIHTCTYMQGTYMYMYVRMYSNIRKCTCVVWSSACFIITCTYIYLRIIHLYVCVHVYTCTYNVHVYYTYIHVRMYVCIYNICTPLYMYNYVPDQTPSIVLPFALELQLFLH